MSDKSLVARLSEIQSKLNAPKNQKNTFGGYSYRSCEDILQAVKPLLLGLVITINDDIVGVGDRIYVKSTATITDGENSISTTAFAREAATKKGMDDSQITGSTSSYARKYALNALLLIDDNKDADSHENRDHQAQQKSVPQRRQQKPFDPSAAIKAINGAPDKNTVNQYVNAARQRGASEDQMQRVNETAINRISSLEQPA